MIRKTTSSTCLGIAVLAFCSCNPQQEALKIFTAQGLTVLEPARDYVALGGIFVVPQHGAPAYLDPYDTLNGTDGTSTPFKSVIMQQSNGRSAGLKAAVGTLGGLVPIPAGLDFSATKQVQLAEIDASGSRYTSQMIAGLLKKPATSAAITAQLSGGNRIFVIQEIYTSKSLSVKSSSNDALGASVYGGTSIPKCSDGSQGGASTGGASAPKGSTTAGSSTSTPTGTTPPAQGASSSSTQSASPSPRTSTGTVKPPASGAAGTSAGTTASSTTGSSGSGVGNVGISIGACWASSSTLSFQSATLIPFAVRLNEVIPGPGGLLQVKVTGFKLPNQALGSNDVQATAFVDPNNPVIQNFGRQTHP
jgi:hypothetical protein